LNDALSMRRLQDRLGYRFADPDLLRQALTHRSAAPLHNERLEFLGDALLGFEVARSLYHRHPNADEGQLSRMRAQLVKRETLAVLGHDLQLGEHMILGSGELRSGGQSRDSTLADAVEAVIAAVFLDGGHAEAADFVHRLLGSRIQATDPDRQKKDPKTRLQEYLQAHRHAVPEYEIVTVTGEAHDQTFKVACVIEDLGLRSEGLGSSRRKAEQQAAKRILGDVERLLS
jgi:ribonuclease-3